MVQHRCALVSLFFLSTYHSLVKALSGGKQSVKVVDPNAEATIAVPLLILYHSGSYRSGRVFPRWYGGAECEMRGSMDVLKGSQLG